jgi:small subunit ribosomal protein S7
MPRRRSVNLQRDIGVDPRYKSPLVQKLINVIMERGKKNVARTIVYDALEVLVKKSNGNQEKGLDLFYKAFDNMIPAIEVRPRRVGGSVYQIPMEVQENRARALAMRWLVSSAADRSDKTMGLRIAHELLDAVENRGGAVKKKSDVHRMAESNRAFSHYAW